MTDRPTNAPRGDRDLRAAVEALAEEWEREDAAPGNGRSNYAAMFARDLRARLAEHPATSAEPDAGGEGLTALAAAVAAVTPCACSAQRARAEAAEALAAERGERLAAVADTIGRVDQTKSATIMVSAVEAALGPEAADLLADRERRAEARGAERALREFADRFRPGDGNPWALHVRARARRTADRIAGEDQ